jgi:hypothetical protein
MELSHHDLRSKAKRLGSGLMVAAALWILLFTSLVVHDTLELVNDGKVSGRGNTLKLVPSLIRAITPCHLPILGSFTSILSLVVAYTFIVTNLGLSLTALTAGFRLYQMRSFQFVQTFCWITCLPLLGICYGCLFWLGLLIQDFLRQSQVREIFAVHDSKR